MVRHGLDGHRAFAEYPCLSTSFATRNVRRDAGEGRLAPVAAAGARSSAALVSSLAIAVSRVSRYLRRPVGGDPATLGRSWPVGLRLWPRRTGAAGTSGTRAWNPHPPVRLGRPASSRRMRGCSQPRDGLLIWRAGGVSARSGWPGEGWRSWVWTSRPWPSPRHGTWPGALELAIAAGLT